jgi:hypothetical protein
MGNAKVMSIKIIWDYTLYWSGAALLFFRDKFCDLAFMVQRNLSKTSLKYRESLIGTPGASAFNLGVPSHAFVTISPANSNRIDCDFT